MPTRVISSEASAYLALEGNSSVSEGGWLRLRVRDVSLSSSSSSDQDEARVTIPTILESVQALIFIGFHDQAANAIMHRYTLASAHEENPDILSFAKGHVRSAGDASLPWDDWEAAMAEMGVKTSLQDAIMDPRFEALRLTQSAMFWVLDTITTKYMYLLSLDREVLGLPRGPRRSEGYVQFESRLSGEHPRSSSTKETQPSSSKAGKSTVGFSPSPARHVGATNHEVGNGEVEFLKGGAYVRLLRAIRTARDPPNAVVNRLENIYSAPPGDFTSSQLAIYLTKQRGVAHRYMEYARHRVTEQGRDIVAVAILHLIIPTDLLDNHAQLFGAEWKEYVMNCRLQTQPFPTHLEWLLDTPIITGPILKANDAMVQELVGDERNFEALEPWRLANGASAQQQCIKSDQVVRNINRQARMWLELLP
ncbi:MAG: hypothetical protein Q9207_001338 [Kuettlingeria erythrocarpa]